MCFNCFKGSFGDEDAATPAPKPFQPQTNSTAQPYGQHTQPPPVPNNSKPAADPNTFEITQAAIGTYLAGKQDNGEVAGVGWWQAANGYSAIALHDYYVHSARNAVTIRQQFERCSHNKTDLINEFNDDTLWFGHALLDLYASVNSSDPWLLSTAYKIFDHVARYQLPPGRFLIDDGSADMGGAVLWTSKQDEDGANTIATSLFAEFAARLAIETPATGQDPERRAAWRFIDASERAVGWLLNHVYRREDNVMIDNISIRDGKRTDWTFTYTTGQSIAAITALARALRQIQSYGKQGQASEYMSTACVIAQASVKRDQWVNGDGILIEHGKGQRDPWKHDDAWVFQSVLVRSLAKFHRAIRTEGWSQQDQSFAQAADAVKSFVEVQFQALRERNCSDGGKGSQYGPWWEGPFEAPTGHSQLGVLDVMATIHAVREQ